MTSAKSAPEEPAWLKRTAFNENGTINPSAALMDVLEERGPLTVEGLLGEVIPLVTENDDGIISTPDVSEWEWSLSDLIENGSIVVTKPNREGYVHSYLDVIDLPSVPVRKMPTVRMVELYAGIGAVRKAMTNLGIPHTSVISEINRYSVKSYMAVHGETENLGDITKIEQLPDCDLCVYGFPCTDISLAGKRAGFAEGSGTRSSLLWEVRRLLEVSHHPDVLIMENVSALVNKTNLPLFLHWVEDLTAMGYTSSWQIMEPFEHGVAQHRPRVFMVSCLNGKRFIFPGARPGPCPVLKDVIDTVERPDDPGINDEGIRMLTPRETWKIMGFSTRDCYRASKVCSDSRLYEQAGNSIVVAVLEDILRGIYLDKTFRTVRTLEDYA